MKSVLEDEASLRFGKVRVLYFAKSAELTGVRAEPVAVPTPISSRELWQQLLRRHPRLSLLQEQLVLAVRQQYVAIGDQTLTLNDGDEVAVVPPLSGG
ncbi:molybdopterin synthase sulfur carrier subunit isoform X2 [Centroberyx affinis]|uniref:molybdopterin synthase sulfur carrier subunit isoform X2 n=1 Tax=Centroberyx affinis TaxID=166261 RepID=UPI003A5C03C4